MAKYIIETDEGKFEVETDEKPLSAWEKIKGTIGMATGAVMSQIPFPNIIGGNKATEIVNKPASMVNEIAQKAIEKLPDPQFQSTAANVALGLPEAALSTAAELGSQYLTPSGAALGMTAIKPTKPGQFGESTIKKGLNTFSEWSTGEKAWKFNKTAKKPSTVLPEKFGGSPSVETAKAGYKEALQESGLVRVLDPRDSSAAPFNQAWTKMTDGIPTQYLDKEETIKELVYRLDPQEAFEAYDSLQQTMKGAVAGKNDVLMRSRVIMKDALQDYLESLGGNFKGAAKDFAEASLGQSMTNILPRSKYGQPTIARNAFSASVYGPLGFAAGSALGGPIGGAIGAAGATLAGSSPLVHGVATAGAGALAQGAQSVLGSNLAVKGAFADIMRRYRENQRKTK